MTTHKLCSLLLDKKLDDKEVTQLKYVINKQLEAFCANKSKSISHYIVSVKDKLESILKSFL